MDKKREKDKNKIVLADENEFTGGEKIMFASALIIALIMYTVHLGSDLYGDEWGHTYKVVATGNFWQNISDPSMCHPPLYFILAKLSYMLTGVPWGIRLPSVVFAIGTVILVAYTARRFWGRRFFILAAWIAALSPFLLEFSTEGRAYSTLIFFSVAFIWSFHKFILDENVGNLFLIAGTSICGAMTHYFFWFLLMAGAVYYLIYRRGITKYAVYAALIVGIILLPQIYGIFIGQGAAFTNYLQVDWAESYFSIPNFLARLMVALTYGYSTFDLSAMDAGRNFTLQMVWNNWLLIILCFISFLGIGYSIVCMAFSKTKWVLLLSIGCLLPIILGISACNFGFYLIREKHLAIIWGCYILLQIFAIDFLSRRKVGWIIIACHFIVVLVSLVHYVAYPNEYTRRMDWTGLNQVLEKKITNNDVIIYYMHDPFDISLGSMEVMKRDIRKIRLKSNLPQATTLSDFARHLDRSTTGKLYLLNNETERHQIDPNSEFIAALKSNRKISEQRFGRNLILYSFIKE